MEKTAYEMRISDWSSDVCSSGLLCIPAIDVGKETDAAIFIQISGVINQSYRDFAGKSDETFLSAVGECFFKLQNTAILFSQYPSKTGGILHAHATVAPVPLRAFEKVLGRRVVQVDRIIVAHVRSEEHTSELQSIMHI